MGWPRDEDNQSLRTRGKKLQVLARGSGLFSEEKKTLVVEEQEDKVFREKPICDMVLNPHRILDNIDIGCPPGPLFSPVNSNRFKTVRACFESSSNASVRDKSESTRCTTPRNTLLPPDPRSSSSRLEPCLSPHGTSPSVVPSNNDRTEASGSGSCRRFNVEDHWSFTRKVSRMNVESVARPSLSPRLSQSPHRSLSPRPSLSPAQITSRRTDVSVERCNVETAWTPSTPTNGARSSKGSSQPLNACTDDVEEVTNPAVRKARHPVVGDGDASCSSMPSGHCGGGAASEANVGPYGTSRYRSIWDSYLEVTRTAVSAWRGGRAARASQAGEQMWWCWHGNTKRLREFADPVHAEPACPEMDTFHLLRLAVTKLPDRDLLLDLFEVMISMFLEANLRRRKITECVTLVFATVGPSAVDAFRHCAWKRAREDQNILVDGFGEFSVSFDLPIPDYITCLSIGKTKAGGGALAKDSMSAISPKIEMSTARWGSRNYSDPKPDAPRKFQPSLRNSNERHSSVLLRSPPKQSTGAQHVSGGMSCASALSRLSCVMDDSGFDPGYRLNRAETDDFDDIDDTKQSVDYEVSQIDEEEDEEIRQKRRRRVAFRSSVAFPELPDRTSEKPSLPPSSSSTPLLSLEDFLTVPSMGITPACTTPRGQLPGFNTVFGVPSCGSNSLATDKMGINELIWMTPIDPVFFEHPIQPMGNCSGGTASFYDVRYQKSRRPLYIKSDSYWIGKDLSHATDEMDFYEELRELVLDSNVAQAWKDLAIKWCCCCAGVLDAPIASEPQVVLERSVSALPAHSPEVKHLLLLQNLRDGFGRLRMLDLKIGPVTAVGGWRGKSEFRAWRNHHIDRLTNSAVESYRLEGIDNPPSSLNTYFEESRQTLIASFSGPKKVKRMILQRMRAGEFLNLWLDCRGIFPDTKLNEKYAHLVLLQTAKQLREMMNTFSQLDAPQMWIGSSIALGFDVEPPQEWIKENKQGSSTPSKGGQCCLDEKEIADKVLVKLFDWGRSELNSPQNNRMLSEKSRRRREKYWKRYLEGVCRLLWECARLYVHRAASPVWRSLVFELATFHTMHSDVVVAAATLPVTSIDLGEAYTIDLTSDRVVEARLDVVFLAFSPTHISVHVKKLCIFRRKTTRCIVGCVAFSNPEDVIEYTAMVANGKGAGRRSFQGRLCSQYTGLCDSEPVSAGPGSPKMANDSQGPLTVLHFRDEVFEFIADPTGEAERKLADALDLSSIKHIRNSAMPESWRLPCSSSTALEERFPPCVGDSMQDRACAEVFRDEIASGMFGHVGENDNAPSSSSFLSEVPS